MFGRPENEKPYWVTIKGVVEISFLVDATSEVAARENADDRPTPNLYAYVEGEEMIEPVFTQTEIVVRPITPPATTTRTRRAQKSSDGG